MKGFSVKFLLTCTCVYYTASIVLLCLAQLLFSQGEGALGQVNLSGARLLWLLPFALTLTLARVLRSLPSLPGGLKFPLHMVTTLLGFFLFAYLPARKGTVQNPVVFFSLLLVVYLLIALIWYLFHRRYHDQKDRETPYHSQYQKPNS